MKLSGLNPSYTGKWSRGRTTKTDWLEWHPVLTLLILENGLGVLKEFGHYQSETKVLTLLILENGLGEERQNYYRENHAGKS